MKFRPLILLSLLVISCTAFSQNVKTVKVKKTDLKRDVEMVTDKGTLILRLSDSTPLHRDNFIRLTKSGFFDGITFHRVIKNFMIQAGDPNTKHPDSAASVGSGGPGYTIPAEIIPGMFHHKGALAAARMGDQVNPQRESSGSQFYIVQGKVFTPAGLDSLQNGRLRGYIIPEEHRKVYTTIGGAPHLDNQYTVFGRLIEGYDVLDAIAEVKTNQRDRPEEDVRIIKARMIKRKKNR
jgi:cyclophilin family peptidyl-prolyl cis-trans isomerase